MPIDSWNNAPSVLAEWIGRNDLIIQITNDWNDSRKHVTGLIGFGGEGKSSLARKWVETLERSTFDGLFWWGFYENRSVDEFLEAALKYMSGGRIDPRQVQSSNLRAQIIGAMLGAGCYLFVLDGLEVMQHQEGDQYGLLQSNDLRDLLTFFARPDNQSFCLITSRSPLFDLMNYTTYTHRDVERLSQEDGHALLRRLGVNGSDNQLNKVVADWDGHALTLSLVGSYLVKQHKGDVRFADKIRLSEKKWGKDAPEQYKHVSRILRRYDKHLSATEKAFLLLFSAFRTPIHSTAYKKVFRKKTQNNTLNNPLTKLRKPQFDALVERLVTYRIIRYDAQSDTYTTHPLIRNHYFALLARRAGKRGNVTRTNVKHAHLQIKDYYLSIAGDTPEYPTLDDLKPLIEVVYHACEAGAYDEAWNIYQDRISQGDRFVVLHEIGAHSSALELLREFVSKNRDALEIALVSDSYEKALVFHWIGYCLMIMGRLSEAVPYFERAVAGSIENKQFGNASTLYQNLADLHAWLGAVGASADAAHQALDLARRAEDRDNEITSLCYQAWTSHLLGNIVNANSGFSSAEKLQREITNDIRYSYSAPGIQHADHLHRRGDLDYARRVTEANLEMCERNHWVEQISLCHRVLGDLDFDAERHTSVREHYEFALKIARGISTQYVLIEALLARGRWQAKYMKDSNAAFSDLNEALGYCVESGYRIYEADVRVALGWAYLANNEKEKAKQSAERALQMSNEMGYHWGKVDAQEVIARSGEESKPKRNAKSAKTKKESKPTKRRRSNPK